MKHSGFRLTVALSAILLLAFGLIACGESSTEDEAEAGAFGAAAEPTHTAVAVPQATTPPPTATQPPALPTSQPAVPAQPRTALEPTPTRWPVETAAAQATQNPAPTPTAIPVVQPTATPELIATAAPPTATAVPPPTATAAAQPTAMSVPPTATAAPPTATTVPPTATAVPPTATAVPPTATAVPPTATVVPQQETGTEVGQVAPSFTLPRFDGGEFSTDERLGQGNLVIVFYRAYW